MHHYLNSFLKYGFWSIGCVLAHIPMLQADEYQPALVIIIDDLGNNWKTDQQAANLPGPVTLSILPHTPFSVRLAHLAHSQNKDIMLHVPMQNHAGIKLGEGGLTEAMDKTQIKQALKRNISSIPHVLGVNNHTGSALTEQQEVMQWVMETIVEADLFFVDSKTSLFSVAYQEAQRQQVPSMIRDVFLDNDTSYRALDNEFNRAIDIAREQGIAVLIGHPYPQTMSYLEQAIPKLDSKGIRLVSVSAFIEQVSNQLVEYRKPVYESAMDKERVN